MSEKINKRLNMIFRSSFKDIEKNSSVLESIESKTYKTKKQKEIEKKVIDICLEVYPKAKIIQNYVMETKKGKILIDVLMINKDGIFVFDAKDISCKIVSNFKKEKITIENSFGKKFAIINPVKYNVESCLALYDILKIKIKNLYKNIVVFGDDIIYEKEELKHASIATINTLKEAIEKRAKETKDVFLEEDIKKAYDKIIERGENNGL